MKTLSRGRIQSFLILPFILGVSLMNGRSVQAVTPPKCAILAPIDGQTFTNPTSIEILATGSSADGSVVSIEAYADGQSLGQITPNPAEVGPANPYHWSWSNPPAGDHKLSAQARDSQGATAWSEGVLISVTRDAAPAEASIETKSPVDGQQFTEPALVKIDVVAVDPNGDIRHVEYFANGQFIGASDHLTKEATIPGRPIEHFFDWQNVAKGQYSIVAKAKDTLGNLVESKAVTITVNPAGQPGLPVVSIEASVPYTSEPSPTVRIRPGAFTLKRTGDTTESLRVFLAYEGDATPGIDYQKLENSIEFPVGAASVDVLVYPVDDDLVEGDESVAAVLTPPPTANTPAYSIDLNASAAKVVIHDSDQPGTATIQITSPRNGENFETGKVITISATAIDPASYIARVEFYDGEKLIGVSQIEFLTAPDPGTLIYHSFDWVNAPEGPHQLTARGVDAQGNKIISPVVNISVGSAPRWPVVSIETTVAETTEPSPEVDAPAGVFTLRRTGDTTSALKVWLRFDGSATPGVDYKEIGSPVEFPEGASELDLSISALDDQLVEGDESVAIYIMEPPTSPDSRPYTIDPNRGAAKLLIRDNDRSSVATLEITSPREGQSFQTGDTITINATAIDPAGYIPRVEFYDGDQLIGVSRIDFIRAPDPGTPVYHTFEWANAPAGKHTLTVRVFDAAGNALVSAPVHIYVGNLDAAPVVSVKFMPDLTKRPWPAADYAPDWFVFSRAGPATGDLEVLYKTGGTATAGEDYKTLPGSIVIPAGQSEIAIHVEAIDDKLVEGNESVEVSLLPPPTNADPARSPAYVVDPENSSAKLLIYDDDTAGGGGNQPPLAGIGQPENGSVYNAGEVIVISASAKDPDGTIARLDIFANDKLLGSTKENELLLKWSDAAAGIYALTAHAVDNAGAESSSDPVKIMVRGEEELMFVHRPLPSGYLPGVALSVRLQAEPPATAVAYALEDQPPSGWKVSDISDEGAFDPATGKVKFGPYTDHESRTLTYALTPPADATQTAEFTGLSSIDGKSYRIGGDRLISPGSEIHPADNNTADHSLDANEVTAYAAAWKQGQDWPSGPNPIPLTYLTRAGMIWKLGESYFYDSTQTPPLCWAPQSSAPKPLAAIALATTAVREVLWSPDGASAEVKVTVTPAADVSVFAVEESVPKGWTPIAISGDGQFESSQSVIRWGLFLNPRASVLTYSLVPASDLRSTAAFRGFISFDGQEQPVQGNTVAEAKAGDAPRFAQIKRHEGGGIDLQVSGSTGRVIMIEASDDLSTWTSVKPVFLPDGQVTYTDSDADSHIHRFYRIQTQ